MVSATGDGKFPMIDEESVNGKIFIVGPELVTFDLVCPASL